MSRELVTHNRPVFDQLHPRVYAGAIGLVAWFALAAWILFDRQDDIGLLLGMASVLPFITVLVPLALALVWRKYHAPDRSHPDATSFKDWRAGDFAVWGGRLRATDAAIDLLLPLAAVAFGLTAIGIVFVLSVHPAA